VLRDAGDRREVPAPAPAVRVVVAPVGGPGAAGVGVGGRDGAHPRGPRLLRPVRPGGDVGGGGPGRRCGDPLLCRRGRPARGGAREFVAPAASRSFTWSATAKVVKAPKLVPASWTVVTVLRSLMVSTPLG